MNETTKTFSIRENLTSKVEALVARLNRRAVKLGVPQIDFVKSAPVLRPVEIDEKNPQNGHLEKRQVWVSFVDVTMSLNIPKLADYTFVCTIQHSEVGNLLLTVPGNEALDLSIFRTCAPNCCHCNQARVRKDTYVVRHDVSGKLLQVGKDCLADFTGYGKTPEQAADFAAWLSSFARLMADPTGGDDDDNEVGYGAGSAEGVGLITFLSFVVAVSNKTGFRTRAQAELTQTNSTKEDALWHMEPPRGYRKERILPTEEDKTFAIAARDWAKSIEVKSDFDHNLKVVASADGVLYRNLGIAAYLVEAYRRHLGMIAKRAARPESKHFGEVGKRLRGLKLTYAGNYSFDSQFGVCFIHRFVTEDGSDVIWKSSSLALCKEGETITVDATVKSHGDYKGRPQTVLSRLTEK